PRQLGESAVVAVAANDEGRRAGTRTTRVPFFDVTREHHGRGVRSWSWPASTRATRGSPGLMSLEPLTVAAAFSIGIPSRRWIGRWLVSGRQKTFLTELLEHEWRRGDAHANPPRR